MPKRIIQRFLPDHRVIRDHRHLQVFGTLLHDPNLFHLNRRSVAGAAAVGLFFAWMPVPLQMVFAAATAIIVRVNLPLSVVLVWITNPITMPPLFFFAYKTGTWVLGRPIRQIEFQVSIDWLMNEMVLIWKPFLLGCLIMGVASGLFGYVLTRLLWRWHVIRQWEQKKARRIARRSKAQI